MTLSLLALSDNELEIYKRTRYRLNETEAAKAGWQDDKLIFDNYKAIHQEYLKLYHQTDEEAIKWEALKRLIFLNWNLVVETDWITGIDDLDEAVIVEAYTILNQYMVAGKFDKELIWMLNHYAVWDYAILQYVQHTLPELTQLVNNIGTVKKKFPLQLPADTFANRGQMGIYWESMIKPAGTA